MNRSRYFEPGDDSYLNYDQFDFIGLFQPDPPWVYIPKANDEFLQKHFLPLQENSKCHFCNQNMKKIDLGRRIWPERMRRFIKRSNASPDKTNATLNLCTACGWWVVSQIERGSHHSDDQTYHSLIDLISICWAKLRVLDTTHLQAPLEQLRKQREKRTAPPISILADMIEDCFRSQFPCEVAHVGKTDRADYFIIDADQPALLQFSNRDSSFQFIQELLGVEITSGHPDALWVSATSRMTGENELLVLQNEGFPIELTNFDAIQPLISKSAGTPYQPWEIIWSE